MPDRRLKALAALRWVGQVFALYKSFEHLLPDAPELVEKVLLAEADPSTKRNAFLMLFQASQERAVAFLVDNIDQVASYSDSLQLIVLELIRKVVGSASMPFQI